MANGGFSANKLTKDIPVGESQWPSGSGSIHAFVGANLGVNFDVEQFSIYPYAGLAYSFFEPNLKTSNSDPALNTFKVDGLGIKFRSRRYQSNPERGTPVSVPNPRLQKVNFNARRNNALDYSSVYDWKYFPGKASVLLVIIIRKLIT